MIVRGNDFLLTVWKLMDGRFVEERAFSNDEVARGKAVIQDKRRMCDRLWHLEDESAQDTFTGSNFLCQFWTLTMLSVIGLLCGLRDVDVGVAVIQAPTKTALRLYTTM